MRYLLIVVFSIFSYAGLIHVFAAGMTGSPVSYIFYTLSAAALVADIWALRDLYRLSRNHLKDFPVLYRLVTDFPFRKQITFSAGFLISFLNAVIHLLAGLKAGALWQILLGLFFLVLCGAKSVILGQHIRGTDAGAESRKLYRRVGVLVLILCVPLAAILVMMELQGYSYDYRGYLIYGMAAIVFYNVILSSINLFRYRKYHHPALDAVKNVDYVNALLSLQGLETAMIARFGAEAGAFRFHIVGITGAVIFLVTLAIGVYMVFSCHYRIYDI